METEAQNNNIEDETSKQKQRQTRPGTELVWSMQIAVYKKKSVMMLEIQRKRKRK